MVRSSSAIDLEMAGWVVLRSVGRLAHAAGLHHGHEDVQVVQLHSAADAIAQLHGGTHCRTGYDDIKT